MDSCGGAPLANHTLVVLLTDHAIKNKHSSTNIASGQTDANGRFQIKCPNYGDGEIRIVDSATGFRYTDKYPVYSYIDSVVNLGNMYLRPRIKAVLNIEVVGGYKSTDTLFIGNSARSVFEYYYPIANTTYSEIFSKTVNGYDRGAIKYSQGILYWGIGMDDFMNAAKKDFFTYRICDYADTIENITINYPY
jgi:hypothetical protein